MAEEIPLQPLRIHPGWRITYNTWLDLEPTPENMLDYDHTIMLDMVSASGCLGLSVLWVPPGRPEGQFDLSLHRCDNPTVRKSRRIWKEIDSLQTPNREEIVRVLEILTRTLPSSDPPTADIDLSSVKHQIG